MITKLDISSNEPDWNVMILQTMKFKEFLDRKALLDMMDDDKYVGNYKFILQTKFDEMVEWFITKKLGVTTRPIPAYASNNRKVCLLDLYLVIEREGGHQKVTENNLWPMIAKEIGFEYSEGELMRLMYAMYLDVLVYYHKFKTIQSNVHDKEMTEEKKFREVKWFLGVAEVKEIKLSRLQVKLRRMMQDKMLLINNRSTMHSLPTMDGRRSRG
ncbi:putative transcription factor & chromatin remodeling ARID family [Helianthus annuus]|uniref:Transcription factor & chromatin remodeling ARID family n=1 Tax=Helianthus annuus TaxID=4232 RepID=A0A9K3J5T0_HELAN|nr:putative transcription factor & chromatin remodeling ARID family [Helianthus annuus]KAJ0580304.1 putative transcription factor & chromatin remodeling ARID family [Helianthus annuus]KAJ0587808.1 putative transcription factor & chromatin remodeling ARID family [Helianthus annuus]KAJ0596250.1 putative transcription factor & chromatin remodeling ARID family [Helianthus annuus]KAJ0756910.1 putative transcription factor & chromatin remodeling ARID family [Helianthus annuus]